MIPKISSMIKDENGISVQIGNGFKTVDASASPKLSPITLTGGVQSIQIPEGAVEIILMPTTNDLAVTEDPLDASYDLVLKSSKESFPCARMPAIYVQGTTGDTLYFRFTIV